MSGAFFQITSPMYGSSLKDYTDLIFQGMGREGGSLPDVACLKWGDPFGSACCHKEGHFVLDGAPKGKPRQLRRPTETRPHPLGLVAPTLRFAKGLPSTGEKERKRRKNRGAAPNGGRRAERPPAAVDFSRQVDTQMPSEEKVLDAMQRLNDALEVGPAWSDLGRSQFRTTEPNWV